MISENDKYRKSVSHKIFGEYLDVRLTPENFDFLNSEEFICSLGKCQLRNICNIYYLNVWFEKVDRFCMAEFQIKAIDEKGFVLKNFKTKEIQRIDFEKCTLTHSKQ